jgi:thiol:disulfide interchange protein DsbD
MGGRMLRAGTDRVRAALAVLARCALALCVGIAPAGHAEEAGIPALRSGGGVLEKLRGLTSDAQPEFLPVEEAFAVSMSAADAQTVVAEFRPEEGYYLYRDKFSFSLAEAPGVRIQAVELPRGELKQDPNFGDTEVFHKPVRAVIRLERDARAAQRVALDARYQGCAEAGLCYPPETRRFEVLLAAAQGGSPGAAGSASAAETRTAGPEAAAATPAGPGVAVEPSPQQTAPGAQDETSRIARIFASGNFWLILATFFGFGLLLAFTPCVLPMVPILSGIIVGRGHGASRSHAFLLSLVYVLGMALTYAVAGIAAGLSGTLLTTALQSPWVLGGFALLFVLLALSMFGFYELQLPTALQSRLSIAAYRLHAGTFGGVFAMGVLSALIVGPCVAAPLAGALLYINQSRDAVLGGSALFAMALGMGAPLLALGLSAGSLLPRAGPWMQTVKNFFGVVLLGLAVWIVTPILPAVVPMLLWAALLIISAIYLHAIDPLPHNASGLRRLWKGVGLIALLVGVALLVGALAGSRDPLQPLSTLRAGVPAEVSAGPRFLKVRSVQELDSALAAAQGRPVMLDFYADWCVSCKEMERFTFTDEQVRARMERMVLLKADVTANSPADAALLRRFGLFGPPGTIFFDARGRELPGRVIGFQAAEPFARALDMVLEAS